MPASGHLRPSRRTAADSGSAFNSGRMAGYVEAKTTKAIGVTNSRNLPRAPQPFRSGAGTLRHAPTGALRAPGAVWARVVGFAYPQQMRGLTAGDSSWVK